MNKVKWKVLFSELCFYALACIAMSFVFLAIEDARGQFGSSANKTIDSPNEIEMKPANYVEIQGYLNLPTQNEIRFNDTTGGEYVSLKAPGTISSTFGLVLPDADGTSGQVIITDGLGNLSFSDPALGFTATDDNRLLRSDTVDGNEIQESVITLDDTGSMSGVIAISMSGTNSVINLVENDSHSTPTSGFARLYFDLTEKKLATKDDTGTIVIYGEAGASESVSTQSANYTILDNDGFTTILVDDTSTDRTITLPTAADNTDRRIRIKNVSTDKGNVIVDGEGAETIDTEFTTVDLNFEGAYISVQSDGTGWFIVSENITSPRKTYTLTATETNWTTDRAVGQYWGTLDGNHWLSFVVVGTLSAAASSVTVDITGITFQASVDQAISCFDNAGSASISWAWADNNTNTIACSLSATATTYTISGFAELTSKPTFVE